MTLDLFEAPAKHDAGGKSRWKLPAGVTGHAIFSDCGQYRRVLTRTWGPREAFALWVGMNPSVAEADVNDPTVSRECTYTRVRLGLDSYAKCNVMDYRATDPKKLLEIGIMPCSPANEDYISQRARRAAVVIVAFGTLPKQLRMYAEDTVGMLMQAGIKLHCVGFTKDGSPRHPLYVRGDAPLLPYPREAA